MSYKNCLWSIKEVVDTMFQVSNLRVCPVIPDNASHGLVVSAYRGAVWLLGHVQLEPVH